MYGALDVAERLRMNGASALPLASPVTAAPRIGLRAANPFLVLQADHEASWWLLDPSFWTEYLDMMARARLDYLDLHGMYDLDNTNFPDALLWFSTSASFPAVGVAAPLRAQNLAMLDSILGLARVRGIQVGLMSYSSNTSPRDDGVGPSLDAEDFQTYTREAVQYFASNAPGLAHLGFRVGEGGQPASWYESTFLAGLAAAHSGATPSTRTWEVPKSDILSLAASTGPELLVEAKYNGEHLGLPYVVAGGRMASWGSYSYQDYLSPPTPYRFVSQVRSGGTHRIFRYASYARTRRAVLALGVSPRVQGFSFEAAHAYLPQRDFYHKNPADSFSPWTFRRDELAYLLFGRLGYDPSTPDSVFEAALAERVGTPALWQPVQAASDIVPWIVSANTCGPDQRSYAPELELGGDVAYWASSAFAAPPAFSCDPSSYAKDGHGPFDTFAIASPSDAAADLVAGRGTSRVSPVDVALLVLADAKSAREASLVEVDPSNVEARDYVRECLALADLGDWFAHKLRAATALAVYELAGGSEWLASARSETALAHSAFTTLASDTDYIAPFDERMRMQQLGLLPFHWKKEVARLPLDVASIDKVVAGLRASPPAPKAGLPSPAAWLNTARPPGPELRALTVTPTDPNAPMWTVTATLAEPPAAGAEVNILYRPFPSDGPDWASVRAEGRGVTWRASVPGTGGYGGMFAVEVTGGPRAAYRYPDVTVETPYRTLPP
jgi:hypothetical protein